MSKPSQKNSNLVKGKYSITDLVDIDKLRDLFEKFTIATGFTIGFLDHPEMNVLISSGWRDICTQFHRGCPKGEAICVKSNLHLLSQLNTPHKLIIESCEHGLVDCAMPIFIEGVHIASLATGQLLLNKPADVAWFKKHARKFGFNEKEYMKALDEIPVVMEDELKKVTSFLGTMAQVISEMGYTRLLVLEEAEHMKLEITERKRIATELMVFRSAVDNATDAIGFATAEGSHFYQNKAFGELFGEIGEVSPSKVYVDKEAQQEIWRILQSGKQWIGEVLIRGKDGSERPILLKAYPIMDEDGKVVTLVGGHTDLTELKKTEKERLELERKLRQTQKMDVVGQLAGGVAHDFNNMLAGIMGGADLLAMKLADNEKLLKIVKVILASSVRASELTQKLLAVSHKAEYKNEPCHMHTLLNEVMDILTHSLEKNIEMQSTCEAKRDVILGDATQLQNLIVNIAVNSRDAMPNGGVIRFITREKYCDELYCEQSPFALKPGDYFELEISDTGCGMSDSIRERIFEPFFTTKDVGKGTGLGLSTVYNMVIEHDGEVVMYSAEGIGSTLKVSFPLVHGKPKEYPELDVDEKVEFKGHVLIVDDEDIVLTSGALLLKSLGFSVTCAHDGASAIEIFSAPGVQFDLVLLDLIMPGKSGEETLHELRAISRTVPIIISSGFSFDTCKTTLLQDKASGFLQKPYTRLDLASVIRKALQ